MFSNLFTSRYQYIIYLDNINTIGSDVCIDLALVSGEVQCNSQTKFPTSKVYILLTETIYWTVIGILFAT